MSSMANVLSAAKRVQIVSALIEGMSVRATARMVDVSKDTVGKLSTELGEACGRYMDENLRELPCKRLELTKFGDFVMQKIRMFRKTRSARAVPVLLQLLPHPPDDPLHARHGGRCHVAGLVGRRPGRTPAAGSGSEAGAVPEDGLRVVAGAMASEWHASLAGCVLQRSCSRPGRIGLRKGR
jgi:hypothetical protein